MRNEYLKPQEVCQRIKKSMSWLYKFKDAFVYYKPSGTLLFDAASVDRWVERSRVNSNEELISEAQTRVALSKIKESKRTKNQKS